MKSVKEITNYYRKNLRTPLLELEAERKDLKSRVNTLFMIEAIVLVVLFFISLQIIEDGTVFSIFLLVFGLVVAYGLTKRQLTKKYVESFKINIVTPLISFIDKNLHYRKDKYVNKETFLASKIETEKIESYHGDDFIYGNIDGVNIKLSELTVMVKHNDESDLALWGLFIVAEFPKHFKYHTIIYSKKGRLTAPKMQKNYESIKMDSPEFIDKFTVYATDQIEARYILSHTLMERLIEYHKAMSYPMTVSFCGGNIYIATNCGEVLEPSLQKSLLDSSIAQSYAHSLHFAVSVVEALKLDLKLWSKY